MNKNEKILFAKYCDSNKFPLELLLLLATKDSKVPNLADALAPEFLKWLEKKFGGSPKGLLEFQNFHSGEFSNVEFQDDKILKIFKFEDNTVVSSETPAGIAILAKVLEDLKDHFLFLVKNQDLCMHVGTIEGILFLKREGDVDPHFQLGFIMEPYYKMQFTRDDLWDIPELWEVDKSNILFDENRVPKVINLGELKGL